MNKEENKEFYYPEHEKLRLIQDKTGIVYSFLWWCLTQKNARLFTECPVRVDKKGKKCTSFTYNPTEKNIHTLVFEFFGVDADKLEQERKQMLESIKNIRRIES